jgi:hypothetical protein
VRGNDPPWLCVSSFGKSSSRLDKIVGRFGTVLSELAGLCSFQDSLRCLITSGDLSVCLPAGLLVGQANPKQASVDPVTALQAKQAHELQSLDITFSRTTNGFQDQNLHAFFPFRICKVGAHKSLRRAEQTQLRV